MIWAVLLLAVAGAVAAPYIAEALRPRMDAKARHKAPGNLAKLSRGLTYYRWLGAKTGPVAVCVHGLTTPSYVWEPIAERLGQKGFRVLIYDLYGRGYSDRPKGPQDASFFVTQLTELMDDQGIGQDVTLMGYSMGGAVVTAFAAVSPGRLRHVVLLASAGLGHDLGPLDRLATQHGRLGKWLMMALYGWSMRKGLEAERGLDSEVEGIVDLQLAELKYRGFRPAVMASMCGLLDGEQEEDHRKISRAGLPLLAIWGRDDDVIPVAGLDKLAGWNPKARQEVVENAGHALAYTHVDEVLHAMRGAL